jgi:cystathionine beta-lyase
VADSLGGVESLACLPYEMTHGSVPAEVKHRIGITPSLVRLSVGLEDRDDLLEDLRSALA